MARSIRIEYEDAYYHVMARGNHRQSIFLDDDDRRCFLETLGEACEMTGWKVHAWVLMENHYHLFIQTPEANLVEGMKWLQNSYTRRFNVRHKEWGRLFGDRYKAILVEGENSYYYETLIDYIHLNPLRAGLIKLENQQSILDYPWSSIAEGYALLPNDRKAWMNCQDGLKVFGFLDTVDGRQRMVERLDRRAIEEKADHIGVPLITKEIDKRCSHLRKGWYWGSQKFSEEMLLLAKDVLTKQRSRGYHSAGEHKAHGLYQAEKCLEEGLIKAHLSPSDLPNLTAYDAQKVLLALLLRKTTIVSNAWLAEQLKMKSAANVSYRLKHIDLEKLKKSLSIELIEYAISQGLDI
ncbi:MAG TPA: transposase [Chthoniobacterales bacterium]|nr:transposase [Chthoniobacterales bacterium]